MIPITTGVDSGKLSGSYQDKLVDILVLDRQLKTGVPQSIRKSLEWLLRMTNTYYSSKIEGNSTQPKDFLEANDSNIAKDTQTAEMLAHFEAQVKFQKAYENIENVCAESVIKEVHKSFYDSCPDELKVVKKQDGTTFMHEDGKPLMVAGGEYRQQGVKVGNHVPPDHEEIASLMQWVEKYFDPRKLHGTDRVLYAATLHHRLAWIHPFLDGNGRVIRLITDIFLRQIGLEGSGLWSLARGFGRSQQDYYRALASADRRRQSDFDGRGHTSDKGLILFIEYFIDTALEQIKFFSSLLETEKLKFRINYYFDMRQNGTYPDTNLKPLKPYMREIYAELLEHGEMSRSQLATRLRKSEQTLRGSIKQMEEERLIDAPKKQNLKIMLSSASVEVLFPHLW